MVSKVYVETLNSLSNNISVIELLLQILIQVINFYLNQIKIFKNIKIFLALTKFVIMIL